MESDYVDTLLAHPFFTGMELDHVTTIAECGSSAEYQTGEQAPIVIQTRGAGKVLGWSWIFPGEEWKFNARVIRPVKAVVINTPCLNGKIEKDAELGYELLRRVAKVMMDRLQATRMQVMDIYAPSHSTALD
ncbi:MAG: Crp/Fnr family transcriptional regulator [Planctomycetes bacterium]|nr:Crp/Fnr family transcriptional regulator [Planctomycetota bacterium]